jgi:beta propeller repeat protein
VRKTLLLVAAAAVTLSASGCAERLVPSASDQMSPATNGSTVAWEDGRNEETAATDVYMYDTRTRSQQLVAGGQGDQDQPAVSDRYFIWIDEGRLRAMDRSTGNVFSVTNGPATQADPALCGSVVVWSDTANSSDVYAKDLAGGSQIAVATSEAVEAYPACDAGTGRVVYMHAPLVGGSADIRLYNLGTGQTQVVSNEFWNEWRPAISGDRVVWQAWPNQPDTTEGIQIRGKNLSSGEYFVVSDGPGNQSAPAISGSAVVWEDARDATTRLWWRDLATTMNERPADPALSGDQMAPALFARGAVFQSRVQGVWNVYRVGLE